MRGIFDISRPLSSKNAERSWQAANQHLHTQPNHHEKRQDVFRRKGNQSMG